MKIWKRRLALLLALAMLFALAACGSSRDDEDERPSSHHAKKSGRAEKKVNNPLEGLILPGSNREESEEPAAAATEAPAEAPVEAPVEVPGEPPAEAPAEEPEEVPAEMPAEEELKVALFLSGGVEQDPCGAAVDEALRQYVRETGIGYASYDVPYDGDAQREMEKAISAGANVVVVADFLFGYAVGDIAESYPDVSFLCLDMSGYDLGRSDVYDLPVNVNCVQFQEEQAGFLAGYAAVKMGYRKLGFLGGMALGTINRYGYGFVQGADVAARELGLSDVTVKYAFANQFFGDADITAEMKKWYADGTEVVFACGGGLYTSVGEAAAAGGGLVIGMDVDQSATIDGLYGKGTTLFSAVKNYGLAVTALLDAMRDGSLDGTDSGYVLTFGAGRMPNSSFVGLALPSAASSYFSEADYEALLEAVASGRYGISDDVVFTTPDQLVSTVTVQDLGNLK